MATDAASRMARQHTSVAVILNVGGAVLDLAALESVPQATVVRVEFAAGDRAACASATLRHECDPSELAAALRRWAGARGWTVAVAPVARPG